MIASSATPRSGSEGSFAATLQRRPLLVCLIVGLLPIILRLALLPLMPVPFPKDHDEFSYLLGADTFAHGRLTNPPHPMWIHFEAPHVIQQPTYSSKYFPAQALFLAFGERFFCHPWAGVLLTIGLMCSCLCWMLQGWVSPGFAFVTAVLAALSWGVTDYWINSYWGGAVPALGGALVIGSAPRLVRQVTRSVAIVAVLGTVILANSRPFEGVLTVVSTTAVLALLMIRRGTLMSLLQRRIVLPVILLAVVAAGAFLYYNYRVTGNPFLPPYLLYERTYGPFPHSVFLPPVAKPVYRHEIFSRLWDWEYRHYLIAKADPLAGVKFAWEFMANLFVLNVIGVIVLLGAIFGRRSITLPAFGIISLPLAGVLAQKAFLPHYLAPFCGAYLVIVAAGVEACGRWRLGRHRIGHFVLALLGGVCIGLLMLQILGASYEARLKQTGIAQRPVLIRDLLRRGGRHLVIVRYNPAYSIHEDWVYNQADIDASPIVWARDMGPQRNEELLRYFHDRKAWLLRLSPDSLTLQTIPPGS